MGHQEYQQINQCERETIQENNQAKEWSDKKEKAWDLQNLQK